MNYIVSNNNRQINNDFFKINFFERLCLKILQLVNTLLNFKKLNYK